jgi:hypothetical protein
VGDQSSAQASTYTGQHNTEKHRHTSMLREGFEPAIPMFERLKTVLALDRGAIETGPSKFDEQFNHTFRIIIFCASFTFPEGKWRCSDSYKIP